MNRYKITTRHGFYMLEARGLDEVLRKIARSEDQNPGHHALPMTVEYVATADRNGRFPAPLPLPEMEEPDPDPARHPDA